MVTGHRSEVQDTALLIYNGDRQFPLKLKVHFRLWLGLTCTCDLHLWAVSCDLRFGPAAVDVLTAINNDVNLDETRPIYFTWLINHRFVLRESANSAVFILIGNFFFFSFCLPPEIPRDIAVIPSILKRMQRWRVSKWDHEWGLFLCRR